MSVNRRDFLRKAASVPAAAALAGTLAQSTSAVHAQSKIQAGAAGVLPSPERSGIEHVVVVMMENRSFDHFLGWLPGADGRQAGLSYADPTGALWKTHPLAGDFTGCGHVPPDHTYQGGRIQYDAGKMDGFLRSGNDQFSIGYYQEADLTFFGALARQYTTLDRYFCSFMGPTAPNRIFLHAAQTDRISNTLDTCE